MNEHDCTCDRIHADPDDCLFCRRALRVVTIICSAMVLAVGALGIWVYAVNTDFLHGLYLNRMTSDGNGRKLDHITDITSECRRISTEIQGLVVQNHEAMSRLLERVEARNDQDQSRGARRSP